ncbi:copper homeostasis protein CutC [Agromyces sp. Root1464]|uniref:copper homeostasis protein CutC n=1 Tax=Agromyces sp. Root1464 TaxID=1736467 RepID=UPI0006FD451F|nr:copper homeostasis protein CutC [Agromyces sp. Root1464]KQZ08655.1 copper homeostasis protein CutC [Agromyces sp. Root1464]
MPRTLPIEIAVQDVAGVRVALAGGAARVELCQALGLGGLTPSAGLIEAAAGAARDAGVPGFVHVLVRPRGGGFVYDADELDTTVRDIRAAASAGADGIVVGALTDAGALDLEAVRRFVDAAAGLDVTVHRAVDASSDPLGSVAALHALGARRVLSSGGAADCRAGLATLARMAVESGPLEIMAGGGVRIGDIADLAAAGVDAVHLSARGTASRGGPSGPGGGVDGFDVTDSGLVAAAVAAAVVAEA